MAQWILKENGKVVPHCTLHRLTPAELSPSNEVETEKRSLFNVTICGVLGDSVKIPKNVPLYNNAAKAFDALWDLNPYEDDDEVLPFITDADLKDAAGKPFEVCSVADALINMEVMLPNGNSMAIAKVVRHGVDNEGHLVGTFKDNPLLKKLLYDCEFDDGTTRAYSANTIASNIFLMELDADSYSSSLLYEIVTTRVQGRPQKWPTSTSLPRLGPSECVKQLKVGNSWSNGPMARASGLI
jgi:hypothetical protein